MDFSPPVSDPVSETEESSRVALINRLARLLHASGMPAHELEDRMESASRILGAPARFFSSPTALFISFEGEKHPTHFVRVDPPGVNLEQMSQLHRLLLHIERKQPSAEEIREKITAIESQPARYGRAATIVAFSASAATAAIFFGGGFDESLASALVGLIVGAVVIFCMASSRTRYLSDMLAALTATILANLIAKFAPSVTADVTILASLIILIPGLGVTVAVNELATQNLASGTTRLAGAMIVFLTITFGIVMGKSVARYFFDPVINPIGERLSFGYFTFFFVIGAVAFTVLFQAKMRDAGWILLAISTAYGGTRLGGALFAPEAAAWTGAFVLGIVSNLFGRIANRPAALMLVPGLLLLVPGSLGFFSLTALLQHEVQDGIEAAFTMVLMSASIVAGLLMANVFTASQYAVKKQSVL